VSSCDKRKEVEESRLDEMMKRSVVGWMSDKAI